MELPGFCGPTGTVRSPNAACDRLINLYLEQIETDRKRFVLYSMPGLRQVALLPSAPVRGLYESTTGRVFAATATTLYEVFSGWSFLARGTITTGTDPVAFTDDGMTLVLSAQGVGYAMPFATNVLAPLPLTGPQTFGQLGCLVGRVITNEPGTRHWWFSGHFDATLWDPVAYYEAEGRSDLIVTLLADHREVWVGGSQSMEVWVPTGRPFPDPGGIGPFAPMSNVFLEQGNENPWSFAALDNEVYWLGGSPRGQGPLWKAQGYTPVRISTHALEAAMATMPSVGDAVTWTARQGGHAFLGLDFPSGGQTWLFDTATQAWSELVGLAEDGSFLPYPCHTHCPAFAQHLFGDRTTGHLYIWDANYFFYGDRPIYRERTSPHIRNDQQRIRYSKFELVMETGVGLDGSPAVGADPQVMMSYSDDGGQSWSQGRWRSAGRIGATRQQVVWRQLGQSRQRAFRVAITDPVFVAILGASVDAS